MQRGKRVVLLSAFDYTGSGYRICEAVGLYSNNFMQHIVMLPVDGLTQFKATPSVAKPSKKMITNDKGERVEVEGLSVFSTDLARITKIMKDADIIHVKSDIPINQEPFANLQFPDTAKIIQTVCGSGFRVGSTRIAWGKGNFEDYIDTTDFRTALNPDLNYPGFDAVYTPFAYDCELIKPTWKPKSIPIIAHSPYTKEKKGTDIFEKAVQELKKMGHQFEVDIISGVSHDECLRRKSKATLFFDQNLVGSYGNSAVEAMAFGVPTIAYISEMAIEQADDLLDDCPVINCGMTVDSMVNAIELAIHKDFNLKKVSEDTREWVVKIHEYEAMAKQWLSIYDQVYRL